MKLAKLRTLAKSVQEIRLHESPEGVQWLCLPGAYYPLYGLPRISSETELRTVLDISDKDWEDIRVYMGEIAPYDTSDGGDGTEDPLDEDNITIGWDGRELQILRDMEMRRFAVDVDYIAPVRDGAMMYARRKKDGVIAVKHGYGIAALVVPYKVDCDLIGELGTIARCLEQI